MSTKEMLDRVTGLEAEIARLSKELEGARAELVETACEEHKCRFIPAGWMGLSRPWFYKEHDPSEPDKSRDGRRLQLEAVLKKLPA